MVNKKNWTNKYIHTRRNTWYLMPLYIFIYIYIYIDYKHTGELVDTM